MVRAALTVALRSGSEGYDVQMWYARWDRHRPATVDNLVLLTFEEAGRHEEADLEALARADPRFCVHVEGALARVRRDLSCGSTDRREGVT